MLSTAISKCIKKGGLKERDIDIIIAGDLLNQLISANFMARDFDVPFLGVYSACSTITESLILGSLLVDSGKISNAISAAGSHFATAEWQYRYIPHPPPLAPHRTFRLDTKHSAHAQPTAPRQATAHNNAICRA